ncbi:MAG: aldo/keto reductase [Rhodospirillales bacterium]|nr:MAG: aldo/keto reductase [Rhodospirillales bacterium]
MLTRTIPSTGVKLPVIGLGTWRVFDVGADAAARAPLAEVLRALFEAGGSVIDSSPMYGAAEGVVGDLLTSLKARDKAFVATKVWTQGRDAGVAQMRESMRRMAADPVDLMQIHNLVDWRTHLATLRAWKREGRVRHIGVTHYTASAHDELEAALRAEAFDSVQVNYALDDRDAERRLLPAAAERGVAVVVNMPFGGGGLIRRLAPRPLPGWAAEIGCASWAQILLKYLLGHPAVTCVIPGTSQARHMRDNAAAGSGPLPDAALRARMVKEIET